MGLKRIRRDAIDLLAQVDANSIIFCDKYRKMVNDNHNWSSCIPEECMHCPCYLGVDEKCLLNSFRDKIASIYREVDKIQMMEAIE